MRRRALELWSLVGASLALMSAGATFTALVFKDMLEGDPLNHGALAVGFAVMSFSAGLTVYAYCGHERPLWRVSDESPGRTRRDAALIGSGLFLCTTGLEAGAISFHQAHVESQASLSELYFFTGVLLVMIGVIGLGQLILGLRFSKEPHLFVTDEEQNGRIGISYKRTGIALRVSGFAVALAAIAIASMLFELDDMMFGALAVLGVLACIFLNTIGTILYRERPPPFGPYRGGLHPRSLNRKTP